MKPIFVASVTNLQTGLIETKEFLELQRAKKWVTKRQGRRHPRMTAISRKFSDLNSHEFEFQAEVVNVKFSQWQRRIFDNFQEANEWILKKAFHEDDMASITRIAKKR